VKRTLEMCEQAPPPVMARLPRCHAAPATIASAFIVCWRRPPTGVTAHVVVPYTRAISTPYTHSPFITTIRHDSLPRPPPATTCERMFAFCCGEMARVGGSHSTYVEKRERVEARRAAASIDDGSDSAPRRLWRTRFIEMSAACDGMRPCCCREVSARMLEARVRLRASAPREALQDTRYCVTVER